MIVYANCLRKMMSGSLFVRCRFIDKENFMSKFSRHACLLDKSTMMVNTHSSIGKLKKRDYLVLIYML